MFGGRPTRIHIIVECRGGVVSPGIAVCRAREDERSLQRRGLRAISAVLNLGLIAIIRKIAPKNPSGINDIRSWPGPKKSPEHRYLERPFFIHLGGRAKRVVVDHITGQSMPVSGVLAHVSRGARPERGTLIVSDISCRSKGFQILNRPGPGGLQNRLDARPACRARD